MVCVGEGWGRLREVVNESGREKEKRGKGKIRERRREETVTM